MHRPHSTVSAATAAEQAPGLAQLLRLARESGERLRAVQHLLPPPLRACVRPGPIEDGAWCLLVPNAAAAAKLRQWTPTLLAALRERGYAAESIRWKVQRPD